MIFSGTVNAGELYYMPPGHIPIMEEGVEYVEFSPQKDYDVFTELITEAISRQDKG